MNAHTPGPWRVAHGSAGLLGVWPQESEAVQAICMLEARSGNTRYELHNASANAALIAAAPELLAALEDVLGYGEDCAADRDERPGCLERARAAIAKAKGKQ